MEDEMKNKLIVTLALIVAIILSAGAGSASAAGARFPDLDGHWAEGYVEDLAEKGIISGMGDGLFHPDELVTTSQFVKMLIQGLLGSFPPTDQHWASGYMAEALKQDIINENDVEDRDTPLIRRFAARIGNEALNNILKEEDEPSIIAAERLPDLFSCRTCVWSVAQCYVKGIMIGLPDGLFHGDDFLTRAQAAVVITRILDPETRIPQAVEFPEAQENGLISADDALKILSDFPNALLVDVREQEDHDAEYIMGSICVPLADMIEDLSQTEIPEEKDSIIIVYCQKGSRSQKAFEVLTEAGYTNVFSIGGIEDWPYDTYSKI